MFIWFGIAACSATSHPTGKIRKAFYEDRACSEIKFKCLNKENTMKLPSPPYVLTEKDYARIEHHKTLRMYLEISQMLEIYYPGFWDGITDEKVKSQWMEQVNELAKKYFPEPQLRGEIEMMAHICSIVGLDFETNSKFKFITNKFQGDDESASDTAIDIINYLRFELLKKDYSVGGTHYNTWSLRGMNNMPQITRHIPDFYTEAKPQDPSKDLSKIYKETVLNKGENEL